MKSLLLSRLVGVLGSLGILISLNGCFFFINDLAQLAPAPANVTVKEPPDITNSSANFTLSTKKDTSRPYTVYYCWRDRWGWWHSCTYNVWESTYVAGKITISIDVRDLSRDLNDKPSWVRLMGPESASGTPGTDTCLLNILEQDIALTKSNITGTDEVKVIKIIIDNVSMKFTSQCSIFAADIPIRVFIQDEGVEVMSPSVSRATLIIRKP